MLPQRPPRGRGGRLPADAACGVAPLAQAGCTNGPHLNRIRRAGHKAVKGHGTRVGEPLDDRPVSGRRAARSDGAKRTSWVRAFGIFFTPTTSCPLLPWPREVMTGMDRGELVRLVLAGRNPLDISFSRSSWQAP